MIRAIALAAVCLLAARDPVQLVYRTGGQIFYAAYAPVRVVRSDGTTLLEGRTDRYGRIRISLPRGSYGVVARYRDRDWRVTLRIDGSTTLKRVPLN